VGDTFEVFITPVIDQPLEVAGVLCHELVHVVAGTKAGHSGEFIRLSKLIGLTKGKPTAALPGQLLSEKIQRAIEPLGAYPHSRITPTYTKVMKDKKDTSLTCEECGCKVRMSFKWLETAGVPTCCCGGTFMARE
jgi:hypothetical protein